MADFVAYLVEMGFPKEKAEKALSATGNRGVEPAIEWLSENMDDAAAEVPKSEAPIETATNPTENVPEIETGSEVAKSYKCDDCGKLFKNAEEMEFHAAKTKHSHFSESTEEKKPLTEEEKREQLRCIEEKLKQKRLEREEQEKKEALEREKLRMKQGKEMQEAKRRLEEREMKELADARRREKIEEKLARERVKAQIEADKIARKAKFAAAGATSPVEEVPVTAPSKPSEPETPAVKKDYTETKIQVRLPTGKTLVQTFGVQEPLAAVRLYIELNRVDGSTGPFNLMTNFPKKVFQAEDYDMPLSTLGLVPSAVLMVTKA